MESEIKNTVYIGIACTLLAFVLYFVSNVGDIRNDIAKLRNEEVISKDTLQNYNKYFAYDDTFITGMQLIRLITESSSTELIVYVENVDDPLDLDENGNTSTQLYTKTLYTKKPDLYKIVVDGDDNSNITGSPLASLYADNSTKASKACYETYLVYDNADPSTAAKEPSRANSIVTAIHVKYNP